MIFQPYQEQLAVLHCNSLITMWNVSLFSHMAKNITMNANGHNNIQMFSCLQSRIYLVQVYPEACAKKQSMAPCSVLHPEKKTGDKGRLIYNLLHSVCFSNCCRAIHVLLPRWLPQNWDQAKPRTAVISFDCRHRDTVGRWQSYKYNNTPPHSLNHWPQSLCISS